MSDQPRKLQRYDIVLVLREMATLLEIGGASPFEVRAFRNGSESLDEFEGDLEAAVSEGTLTEIPGIGKGLARVIGELVNTGISEDHRELKGRFPPGLPDVLKVPGLGPRKIKLLFEELDVGSLDDLETAAREGRINGLKGFGKKSEEKILDGLPAARRSVQRDRDRGRD